MAPARIAAAESAETAELLAWLLLQETSGKVWVRLKQQPQLQPTSVLHRSSTCSAAKPAGSQTLLRIRWQSQEEFV